MTKCAQCIIWNRNLPHFSPLHTDSFAIVLLYEYKDHSFVKRVYMIYTGLKITAGHQTMSGQIRNLTGQVFYSPVMWTGHIQQSHRNKGKFSRSSVVCDELK